MNQQIDRLYQLAANQVPAQEAVQEAAPPPLPTISYLASPYWHRNPSVMEARQQAAIDVARHLIDLGQIIFCPIAYEAAFRPTPPQPLSWYYFDLHFLAQSAELILLQLPGWQQSSGMMLELGFAQARNIPVRIFTMEEALQIDPIKACAHRLKPLDP